MSILTQLLHKQISFHQAAQLIEQDAANLLAHDPTLKAALDVVVSDAKQAASNAVDMADTLAGPIIAGAAVTVETATTAALARLLGPAGAAFSPLAVDGIERVAAALKAEVDAAALFAKAQLRASPPTAH